MTASSKRWLYAAWLVFIAGFAALHGLHLRADFPNHSPWFSDWAKYTDEGWYGNAAVRAHLFGNWYIPGDFNPAVAVPVWPFLEWMLFFVTGVSVVAARGLAVLFFFANLLLSYLLLRARGPRWAALCAVTLLATSPFLYSFSRLAILEPSLIAFTLGALNLAVRLPRMRHPMWVSAGIGLLFTLMMLTKTTALFLLPALVWAMALPLWQSRKRDPESAQKGFDLSGGKLAARCVLTAAGAFAASFGLWMAMVARLGLLTDYRYYFFINKYDKPPEFYWPLASLWWSFHGGLWVDHILVPLAGLVAVGAAVAWWRAGAGAEGPWRAWSIWGRKLLLDPVFGASILAVAGYILFMTYQNHPQPRYFAVVAFFCIFMVAQGLASLPGLAASVRQLTADEVSARRRRAALLTRWSCRVVAALVVLAAGINGVWTAYYATHPEYTFVLAAKQLTHYIDTHPNGHRLLVSISGDQISLVTHLPALCDDFGTHGLVPKLSAAQPGWYATWNELDAGTLEDLHNHFSVEQVASFKAFDDPERNKLVLFKLRPLRGGRVRDPDKQNLQVPLRGDRIYIPTEE